jgi:starch synthase
MHIAILASEAVPFAKTGGLADVTTALGKELVKLDHQVTLMIPKYRGVTMKPTALISPLRFGFGGRQVTYSIIESQHEGVRVVFIDAPHYFERGGIYGDSHGEFGDNDERFTFFSRACIDYFHRKEERPDVFHCNDWQTGLVPLYLRTHYINHELGNVPVIFTIHNMAYQGIFPAERFSLLDLSSEYLRPDAIEFFGRISFLKAGLEYSDLITTVSKRYSYEIQTREFAHGLEGTVQKRSDRLFGILNGIDDEIWNPETDNLIAQNYSLHNLEGKRACRQELLYSVGWDPETPMPIIGIVSRLATQKGFDLLESTADRILGMGMRMMVLGSGERRYEQFFDQLRLRHPKQMAIAIKFDNVLAHKIEAGADMFLMPSRYEPCGLNQMYSLRYGTVPIVRATGGLDDTVHEWNWHDRTGNGFKFYDYSADSLVDAVVRARNALEHKEAWQKLQVNGMKGDYSWKRSALQYLTLYEEAVRLKS